MNYTAKNILLVFSVLCILFFNFYTEAQTQIFNCPQNQTKFEKLIGIRPDSNQKGVLLYRNKNNSPNTLNCLTRCADDNKCASFLLYYNSSECYSFTNAVVQTQNYDYDSRPDNNVAWFRKTCLNVSDLCTNKAWPFEILAGATLIGYNTKKIKENVTRQRCIDLCLQEKKFLCKSIKFNLISKYMNATDINPIGFCTLSETDRHLTPNSFRVSRYEDEYIENQCVNTHNASEYCSYEEYDDTFLEHVDLIINNLTQPQCQEMCDIVTTFNCRGYSTVPLNSKNMFDCFLHSEDSKLIGPKLLVHRTGATYYEKARCLNVSVSCSNDLMQIIYKPEQPFYGRIYTSGFSETLPCYTDGRGLQPLDLAIPSNGNFCGVTEAATSEPWNRTLKSVLLVIQYNSLIQTQADRLIKVGCVYGNNNNDDQEVTLGTSVNFTGTYPNRGSTIVNTSSIYPNVTMRVVDFYTKEPVSDTEIGQELEMIIEIMPGDGPYDIWAGNLVATSGNNTFQLLDDNGCPTYINIFAPFTKIQTNTSRKLVSKFQAFKFPTNPLVRFNVMVHFCTLECPPIQCRNNEILRLKRENNINPPKYLTNDVINATVYKIKSRKNTDNDTEDIIDDMPLDFIVYVRGINLVPDQLVYNENNRILVAGYDVLTNEVCVDYNLFIGLLVTWVLLQVIIIICCFLLIRKYKKYFHIAYTRQLDDMHQNFGFGSRDFNRRVHWADQ